MRFEIVHYIIHFMFTKPHNQIYQTNHAILSQSFVYRFYLINYHFELSTICHANTFAKSNFKRDAHMENIRSIYAYEHE